jgi:arylsulfatase A-like enzyme
MINTNRNRIIASLVVVLLILCALVFYAAGRLSALDSKLTGVSSEIKNAQDISLIGSQHAVGDIKELRRIFEQDFYGLDGKTDREKDIVDQGLAENIFQVKSRLDELEKKQRSLESSLTNMSSNIGMVRGELAMQRSLMDKNSVSADEGGATASPNVILLVIDALRADCVSAINVDAAYKTKNLDRFAKMGALFTNAISQGPFTRSSMGSVFTGLLPSEHLSFEGMSKQAGGPVPKGAYSVFDLLRGNNYGSYLISQNYNPQDHGLPLTVQFMARPAGDNEAQMPVVVADEIIGFVKTATFPYLLYAHIFDPHDPYDHAVLLDPSLPTTGNSGGRGDEDNTLGFKKYRLEIQLVDMALERVLNYLTRTGYFESNYLIITADHGEYFNDHPELTGESKDRYILPHGFDLRQEQTHVPLILIGPGVNPGTKIDAPTGLTSLFTGILDIAKVPNPKMKHLSPSLLALAKGAKAEPYIFSEGLVANDFFNEQKAVVSQDGYKLIIDTASGREWLYDEKADPYEKTPLDPDKNRDLIESLRARIAERIDLNAQYSKVGGYSLLDFPGNDEIQALFATSEDIRRPAVLLLDGDRQTVFSTSTGAPLRFPIDLNLAFKTPKKITSFTFVFPLDRSIWFKKAQLLASRDNKTWAALGDVASPSDDEGAVKLELNPGEAYKYYRLRILESVSPNQETVGLADLQYTEEQKS